MSNNLAAVVPGQGAGFEQAKKPGASLSFYKLWQSPAGVKAKPEPKLTRVNFTVSRLMEFCSQRELQNQTGHSVYDWPLVVVKELLDNALDACEEAEVAPDITVIVEQDKIIVQDNAGGIDATDHRVDPRLHGPGLEPRSLCVADARGAGQCAEDHSCHGLRARQGAAGDAAGVTIIETRGVAHRIEFRVDHINNQPKIIHTTAPSPISTGTNSRSIGRAPDLLDEDGSSSSSGPMSGSIRT